MKNRLQQAKNSWHYYQQFCALDEGNDRRYLNCTRFIILGRSRTGSTLLRGLLNSHSQILVHYELFGHYGATMRAFIAYSHSRLLLSLIQRMSNPLNRLITPLLEFCEDPIRFLETRVYGNVPQHISAVGFKLFYYHAHNDAWEPVWTYLSNQEDLKVIHIKRKNILRRQLSLKRATSTNIWANKRVVNTKYNQPIFLSYEECLEAFTETPKQERQYDAFFQHHPKIDVLYENLADDYESEMRHIQTFLDVDYEVLKPRTVKQSNQQSLSKAIVNYFELKESFAGTAWEEFFED